MSKWYYQFEITKRCLEGLVTSNLGGSAGKSKKFKEIVITLHQEDEKIRGVSAGRPFLDVSLACFRLRDPTSQKEKKR